MMVFLTQVITVFFIALIITLAIAIVLMIEGYRTLRAIRKKVEYSRKEILKVYLSEGVMK